MKHIIAMIALLGSIVVSPSAHAAPLEQIDCILSQWSDADRFEALQYFGENEEKGASEKALPAKIAGPMLGCAARHEWNDTDTQNALLYTVMNVLAGFQPTIIKQEGGAVDPINAYFEANKVSLIAGPDPDPSVAEAVMRSELKKSNFPVDNAKAFEEAMSFLGTKILIERVRLNFAAGKTTQ